MAETPEIRIGTQEREQALDLLSSHLSAGRLTVSEFDERSEQVANARTRGELDSVFDDLPAQPAQATAAPARRSEDKSGLLDEWPERIMAVVPILALILFFVTGSWLWFLAIPLAGALLFGSKNDRRGRDRRRRYESRDRRDEELG